MVNSLKRKEIVTILIALIGAASIIMGPIVFDLYKSWVDKPDIEVYFTSEVIPEHMKAGNTYKRISATLSG